MNSTGTPSVSSAAVSQPPGLSGPTPGRDRTRLFPLRLNRKDPLHTLDTDLRSGGLALCLTRFHAEEKSVTPGDLGRRR